MKSTFKADLRSLQQMLCRENVEAKMDFSRTAFFIIFFKQDPREYDYTRVSEILATKIVFSG